MRTCAVTVVLHAKRQDPSSAVLAVLPNRELSWGLAELRAQAYCGPPDPSVEFSMREGEQLLLKFSGNIAGMGTEKAICDPRKKNVALCEKCMGVSALSLWCKYFSYQSMKSHNSPDKGNRGSNARTPYILLSDYNNGV